MTEHDTNTSSGISPVPLVYLDSNIFFRMHRGELEGLRVVLEQAVEDGRMMIPFSTAHIEEVMRCRGEESDAEIESTLDFISNLTRNMCFHSDVLQLVVRQESPQQTRDTLAEADPGFNPYGILAAMINPEMLARGRGQLGLSPNQLNNASPAEAVEAIDRVLKGDDVQQHVPDNVEFEVSFKGILTMVGDICRQQFDGMYAGLGINPGRVNYASMPFVMAFSLFDSFGFWPDKKETLKKGSHLQDAQHGFFGSLCHYVVSEDKRFRKKTEATCALMESEARVLDAREAEEVFRDGSQG